MKELKYNVSKVERFDFVFLWNSIQAKCFSHSGLSKIMFHNGIHSLRIFSPCLRNSKNTTEKYKHFSFCYIFHLLHNYPFSQGKVFLSCNSYNYQTVKFFGIISKFCLQINNKKIIMIKAKQNWEIYSA